MSDTIDAIHAIKAGNNYKGVEEDIVQHVRDQFKNSQVLGVWYCKRSLNTSAHLLAKIATKSLQPQAWLGADIPRHLVSKALVL